MAIFYLKSHFAWRKSVTVSLCENCQRQSCKALIGQTSHAKVISGATPCTWNFVWDRIGVKLPIFDLFSLVATQPLHIAKSSINTNRKPLHAFLWAHDEHCTLSLSPQRVAQKCKVSKIWTISCNNSKTVWDSMPGFSDRKSHTGFRLVPTSMTLYDLECRNSPYFAFFLRIRQILRPIMSQWLKVDL